jgi:hypothetical protein
MEALMRPYHLVLATLAGCVLTGATLYSPPAVADWHSPHFYRETNGTWTNAEYDDGVCHYKYSHNSWDQETHLNRWGDCSRVAIGPSGEATPVYAVPVPVVVPNGEIEGRP